MRRAALPDGNTPEARRRPQKNSVGAVSAANAREIMGAGDPVGQDGGEQGPRAGHLRGAGVDEITARDEPEHS